jgi:hypothetical protein
MKKYFPQTSMFLSFAPPPKLVVKTTASWQKENAPWAKFSGC